MLMRILVLFLISPFIYAQVSSEQLEADCLNVKNIAAIGDKKAIKLDTHHKTLVILTTK